MTPRALFPAFTGTLLLASLASAGPALAAWPHAPGVNVPVCTNSDNQQYPAVVSDGAGGAIIAWWDQRNDTGGIYVQRLSAAGIPMWTANGVALCTGSGGYKLAVVSDGAGGAVIAWLDYRNGNDDIYARRVNAAGVPQWTANGVAICTASGSQQNFVMVSDGAGGAILAWSDPRGADADIYAQRVSGAGAVQWAANGVALCTSSGIQENATIVGDGAGSGAIVTWLDHRSGATNDVYAQRVNALGAVQWQANGRALVMGMSSLYVPVSTADGAGGVIAAWYDDRFGQGAHVYVQRLDSSGNAQWTGVGVPVCSGNGLQVDPRVVSDGAGGAIVAWDDTRAGDWDTYVQRLNGAGVVLWPASGVALCAAPGYQELTGLIADGVGGAIAAWDDPRIDALFDPYVRRVSADGVPQWAADGVAATSAIGSQKFVAIVPDGANGAIAAWQDSRNSSWDIYAQRIERYGQLGNPEPAITGIHDWPDDEGGLVRIDWTPSYLDSFPAYGIAQYTIWRQVPWTQVAGSRLAGGAAVPGGLTRTADGRLLRVGPEGAQATYWEHVNSEIARGLPGYSCTATTSRDSLGGSNLRTWFMVLAEQEGGVPYWPSALDSGYSVDNLAPPAPAGFTGNYGAGDVLLLWEASPAIDFSQFELYRGTDFGFVPAPGNRIATLTETGYVDHPGRPCYYRLCAVDVHGNHGLNALALPAGSLDVPGGELPRELALSAPAPNPARGACTARLALPRAARVALAIHDSQGRRVRTLAGGALPAGEHPIVWDGRDDAGRALPNGIYFLRCEAEGRTFTRRIALLR